MQRPRVFLGSPQEVEVRAEEALGSVSPQHRLNIIGKDKTGMSEMPENSDNNPSKYLSSKVGGRLGQFWEAWSEYQVDPWVIAVLKEGGQVSFLPPPPMSHIPQEYPCYVGNPEKFQALQTEVSVMLQKGAIEPVRGSSPGFYTFPFILCQDLTFGSFSTSLLLNFGLFAMASVQPLRFLLGSLPLWGK